MGPTFTKRFRETQFRSHFGRKKWKNLNNFAYYLITQKHILEPERLSIKNLQDHQNIIKIKNESKKHYRG